MYNVYRRDRGGRGGGVLIAVHTNLDCHIVPELEVDGCEILWIRIKLKGCRSLYVCSYYRPDVADENSLTLFSSSIQRAAQISNAYLLIGGDFFIFPGFDWETGSIKPKSSYPRLQSEFLSIIYDNGLEQIVKEPTREDNTLDLFLTNCPHLIPRVEVTPGLSDHCIPYCEFNICAQRKKQAPREIPLYNKADWDSLKNAAKVISSELHELKQTSTTEELYMVHLQRKASGSSQELHPT